MEVLHPELRRVMSALPLAQESRDLLCSALLDGKDQSPYPALRLLWLLNTLRKHTLPALVPLQKTEWLENLLSLIRQGHEQRVRRVCHLLYEGNLPPENMAYPFPGGLIRDLLKWVSGEKSERVREILWAILLRKEIGLASFAKPAHLAAGVCEKDPITRNNVIRFLVDHFTPEQVLDSLLHYSMVSGKRVPGVVFKRYVGLLEDLIDLPQKKTILERVLCSATFDDREMDRIFSDYLSSLSRFDLIRLLSSSDGCQPRFADLKQKSRQMAFAFNKGKIVPLSHEDFRKRISMMRSLGRKARIGAHVSQS